jgi:hypothetical protein
MAIQPGIPSPGLLRAWSLSSGRPAVGPGGALAMTGHSWLCNGGCERTIVAHAIAVIGVTVALVKLL